MDAGLGGSVSDWELKEETVTARQWVRSWRQEFFTDFGQDFRVVAHMEHMTLLPDGTSAKKQLQPVVRDITQVGADPRVQQLNAILTELINEWRLEDMNKQEYNSKVEV
jgi:hypothetical protein